jgi:hypothetical protein
MDVTDRPWKFRPQGYLVAIAADDDESRERYLAYAREGRASLWLRVPDETQVPKALRVVADRDIVHARHYGSMTAKDLRGSNG